nr:immunoglobulin heavy chain junction region [Macaca mulatta]MOY22257.1 immunoglobulin heavy chain junction region [Macaca mulatta]MOY26070.1 immunoglobulin heavy chain junction region [Macaca mulatta]MOY29226.1 immunoglobulin heavy chain junction region [Macaca mulatta]
CARYASGSRYFDYW